jgi:hypothetical protein
MSLFFIMPIDHQYFHSFALLIRSIFLRASAESPGGSLLQPVRCNGIQKHTFVNQLRVGFAAPDRASKNICVLRTAFRHEVQLASQDCEVKSLGNPPLQLVAS